MLGSCEGLDSLHLLGLMHSLRKVHWLLWLDAAARLNPYTQILVNGRSAGVLDQNDFNFKIILNSKNGNTY